MKSMQAEFSFCQPLMLCTASASLKTHGVMASAVLIRIWHLVTLPLQKNKPNMSRKSESLPLNLHGSEEADFHLYLDFLCPLTAATTDMISDMYWQLKTGRVKIIEK